MNDEFSRKALFVVAAGAACGYSCVIVNKLISHQNDSSRMKFQGSVGNRTKVHTKTSDSHTPYFLLVFVCV